MRLGFFYDFETSGLPLFSEPSNDPRQPHIVQCAAVLVNMDTREVVSSFDLIAQQDGWESEKEALDLHGIDAAKAEACGVPEFLIVSTLLAYHQLAEVRIGHVEHFDSRIMRIALKRFVGDGPADDWKAGERECTAKMAKPIMRRSKNPSLADAHQFFLGRQFDGAHTALSDALATAAVYWAIQDHLEREAQVDMVREDAPQAPEQDGEVGFL